MIKSVMLLSGLGLLTIIRLKAHEIPLGFMVIGVWGGVLLIILPLIISWSKEQ